MNNDGAAPLSPAAADPLPERWEPDLLGPGYEATTLHAPHRDGTPWRATLVRHRPAGRRGAEARPAVLFLHGWSDYFYNTGLAEFFAGQGYDFYALDLHNHGRSLDAPALGGYAADLSDYDQEIRLAHDAISRDRGQEPGTPLILMGHSTGGLIAALWAKAFPGRVSQLILNSPWLELQGGAAVRRTASELVRPVAQRNPLTRMRVPERNFYWRGISDEAHGDWAVDRRLRPPAAFPVRAGWMRAIMAAQRQVASGLGLPMPALVFVSSRSLLGPVWRAAMLRADVVLDVRSLAVRALSLGDSVTVERVDGALHEVFLSTAAVREDAYARLARWLRGYVPAPPAPLKRS